MSDRKLYLLPALTIDIKGFAEFEFHERQQQAPQQAPQPREPQQQQPLPLEIKTRQPRAFLSHASLRDRFLKNCRQDGSHWSWINWSYGTPHFSVDGQSMTPQEASWTLYKETVPAEQTPMAKCGRFNCVNPECLFLVLKKVARSISRPSPEIVREIRRLDMLGRTSQEIIEILNQKVDPKTVYKAAKGLAYRCG